MGEMINTEYKENEYKWRFKKHSSGDFAERPKLRVNEASRYNFEFWPFEMMMCT